MLCERLGHSFSLFWCRFQGCSHICRMPFLRLDFYLQSRCVKICSAALPFVEAFPDFECLILLPDWYFLASFLLAELDLRRAFKNLSRATSSEVRGFRLLCGFCLVLIMACRACSSQLPTRSISPATLILFLVRLITPTVAKTLTTS